MNRVAVIPARGGSKRIPRKNIRSFCGQPIISYSVSCALRSELFDEVIVSTDDDEIATIARNFGATVDELRPESISDDRTGVLAVVAHELMKLEHQGIKPAAACLIYATAPMIREIDLKQSFKIFEAGDVDFVFSAAEFSSPIFRSFTILPDGRAQMFKPEYYHSNSQDLPRAYHDAAQFCWGKPEAIVDPHAIVFSERSKPYVLPTNLVNDIDTPEDWIRAEWLFQAHQSISSNN